MCNPNFNDISLQYRGRVLTAFRNSLDQDNSLTSEMRLAIAMDMIIFYLSEISVLGTLPNEEMLQKAYEIASGLTGWKCKPGIMVSRAMSDEPLALPSETYGSAAFIYLEPVLRKRFPQQAVTNVVLGGISTHIEAILLYQTEYPKAHSPNALYSSRFLLLVGELRMRDKPV
ncbi:hypothetical protein FGADI_11115 [Fusarium gaditjirri]|uniref:Uncharacterized protein n=1 Tax=Fusarium gaditjirri TaxID=282569 RepID=A0A8H4SVH9_9HYPO|nr:hypothetical protein FGADI_11115 [Fusarium gaditjirri]